MEPRTLLEELDGIPIKLDEMALLKDEVKKVGDWMTRCKRTFGKAGSAKTLTAILEDMRSNVERCTSQGVETAAHLFCICRTDSEEGWMVECENCNHWYHGPCIRMTRKEANRRNPYICLICDVDEHYPRVTSAGRRPSLDQLKTLADEAKHLSFAVEELDVLEDVVGMLEAWAKRVHALLGGEDGRDERKVKDILRCAEGLPVLMEGEVEALRQRVKEVAPPPVVKPEEKVPDPPVSANTALVVDTGTTKSRTTRARSPEEELYCLCRTPYEEDRTMIQCDKCDQWFHLDCVGMAGMEGIVQDIKTWACPVCKKDAKDEKKRKKSTDARAGAGAQHLQSPTDAQHAPATKIKLKIGNGKKDAGVSSTPSSKKRKESSDAPEGTAKKRKDSTSHQHLDAVDEDKKKKKDKTGTGAVSAEDAEKKRKREEKKRKERERVEEELDAKKRRKSEGDNDVRKANGEGDKSRPNSADNPREKKRQKHDGADSALGLVHAPPTPQQRASNGKSKAIS
ncbi:hypothetical protein HK104_006712, partial [Borealophlyctis nickersoniae]